MSVQIKYRFNGFVLDSDNPRLLKNGETVKLRRQSCDVLIYLLKRHGSLVTKEELRQEIWGESIVTQDSLTHCIIDIRKAIGDHDKTMIQTVPRRGYIVRMPVQVTRNGVEELNEDVIRGSRAEIVKTGFGRLIWTGVFAFAISIAMLLWWEPVLNLGESQRSGMADHVQVNRGQIQIAPLDVVGIDGDVEELARLAESSFAVALSQHGVANVVSGDPASSRQSELALESTLMESNGQPVVDVRLVDIQSRTSVWSARFNHQAENLMALFEQAAWQAVYAIECGFFRRDLISRPISPRHLGMWITGCDLAARQKRMQFYEQALEIVSYAPDDSASYSSLAIGLSRLDRRDSRATNSLDIRAEIRGAAEKALALDANSGEALVALAMLQPNTAWQAQEELLKEAIRTDPRYRWARSQYAMFLYRVGRIDAAISFAQRTTALARGPNHMAMEAWLLAIDRQETKAERIFDEAERLWPYDDVAPWRRFTANAFFADVESAAHLLGQDRISSLLVSTGSRACWEHLLAARRDPGLAASPDRFSRCRKDREYIEPRALATLGFVDEAITAVQSLIVGGAIDENRDFTAFLFNPEMKDVRLDRRFMGIAERVGLATYWHESSQLPDFCNDSSLQYDCREMIEETINSQIAKIARQD